MSFLSEPVSMMSVHPVTLSFRDSRIEKAYLEEYRTSSIENVLSWVPWAFFIVMTGLIVILAVLPGIEKLERLVSYMIIAFLAVYLHFRYAPPSSRLLEIDFALLAILPAWLYCARFLIDESPLQPYAYAQVAVQIASSSLALPVRFLTAVIGQSAAIFGFSFTAIVLSDMDAGTAILQSLFLHRHRIERHAIGAFPSQCHQKLSSRHTALHSWGSEYGARPWKSTRLSFDSMTQETTPRPMVVRKLPSNHSYYVQPRRQPSLIHSRHRLPVPPQDATR